MELHLLSNNLKQMQMKRFPFLSVALIGVLMVVAVGCTVPYETAGGGYYEERVDRGGYYGSPYGSNVIVVERDPYTGRYYEVNPYRSYGYPAGGRNVYVNPRDSRYYDSRNYNNNRGTRYDNNVRNGGTYRNNDAARQQQAQQREQQRQADVRQMESTKESILGKKKD